MKELSALPKRPSDAHKGTFGKVGIIAGQISSGSVMLGSAVYAAKAAVRSGAGAVEFIGEKEVLIELIKMFPQATGANISQISKCSSVVIGPGLGRSHFNKNLLKRTLDAKSPCVVDADGLNVLSENPNMLTALHEKCVLTPHVKEFERLASAAKVSSAKELAGKYSCCIVLKSSRTSVFSNEDDWALNSKNPALATGGTGDVLAGTIGGLIAQYYPKLSLPDCAKWGVAIHSRAGFAWSKEHGSGGMLIEELLDLIPNTMEKLRG